MKIINQGKSVKLCVLSYIAVILILLIPFLFVSCANAVPPLAPNVSGVSDGAVYGTDILIDIRDPQDNVAYAAAVDGFPVELGTLYGKDGKHTLTVTASSEKGKLTSQTTLEFEIDKVPPQQPEITGVEENKNYNTSVRVYVLEERGISYSASIDGEDYLLGTEYEKEGRHELKVYALKKRNGLTAATTIPFSVDKESYTPQEISYFQEIAFGSEFGGKSSYIRKWQENIVAEVVGQATPEDLDSLSRVVSDLNGLIDPVEIKLVDHQDEQPNMTVYFIPNAEFVKHTSEKNALENWGMFFYYDSDGAINNAKVLIASDKPNAEERAHLIREEFTQALGLAQDSERYPDSMFYQGWTTTREFSEMDKKLISMLYSKDIRPNMPEEAAIEYFQSKKAQMNARNQVFPADQSAENPSFAQFAGELQESIAHRDLNYILQHVDEDFTAEPLAGKGVDPFKMYFFLGLQPEQSTLWKTLGEALKLGGVFVDPARSVFEAPYTKARFPRELDANEYKAVIGPDVKVHQYPDPQSAVIDALRYDAVRILQPLPTSELPDDMDLEEMFKWEYIQTFNGKKGYVPIDQLRSPAADIFTFRKKDNRWVISAVTNR